MEVIEVDVTPEARAKVIRSALKGMLASAKMTAGQRRAVQRRKKQAVGQPQAKVHRAV